MLVGAIPGASSVHAVLAIWAAVAFALALITLLTAGRQRIRIEQQSVVVKWGWLIAGLAHSMLVV